ncbi:phosphatase PAP2 family protein [Urechidicola sp. KH5]
MLDRIIEIDTQLLIFINNLGTEQWDGFWLFMSAKWASIPLYCIVLYFMFKHLGTKKALFALLFIGILIAMSDQTSNLFKYGFERLRPCHNESIKDLIRLVKPSCGGKYAFFSAHASTSVVIAVFCSLLLSSSERYLPYGLIAFAVLVGFSRIYLGVHFPFDVLFGFFIGASYAYLMYKLYNWMAKKYDW